MALIPRQTSSEGDIPSFSRTQSWRESGSSVKSEEIDPLHARWSRSMDGFSSTDWKTRVEDGLSATTEMVAHEDYPKRWEVQVGEHYYWSESLPPGDRFIYAETNDKRVPLVLDDYDPETISEALANDEALTNYVKKIRDMQTTFQGSTFAAETIQMVSRIKKPSQFLRRNVDKYTNRIKRLRSRHPNRLKDLRKYAAEEWLKTQFFLKPTLNDVHELMESIAYSRHAVDPEFFKLFGFGEDRSTVTEGSYNAGPSIPLPNLRYRIDSVAQVKYLGTWDFSTYALNSQRLGFSPDNWLPAAWEIVPWSFLIDYFTNIGDIISAVSLSRQGERWTCKTVRRFFEVVYVGNEVLHSLNTEDRTVRPTPLRLQTPSYARKVVERTDHTGESLIPGAHFSVPGSSTKWLNIAALAEAQDAFKRIFK